MNTYQQIRSKSLTIGGMRVDPVQIPQIIEIMEDWIKDKDHGNYIVVSNANDLAESRKDKKVMDAVNNSSLSIPDGFSLVLFSRMLGHKLKERAYGPDLMVAFLEHSENKGYSHFFYGATDDVLIKLSENVKQRFSNINIAGHYSPPFRKLSIQEEKDIIDMINNSGADVLWVALGCPKQQIWMHEYRDKLKVSATVGVGAAFDFIAKTKKQAPKWMQKSGLEWFFRLSSEPKRLWKRYLIGNTIFIWLSLRELIKKGRN